MENIKHDIIGVYKGIFIIHFLENGYEIKDYNFKHNRLRVGGWGGNCNFTITQFPKWKVNLNFKKEYVVGNQVEFEGYIIMYFHNRFKSFKTISIFSKKEKLTK